jgi:hypothetical protein
MSLRATVLLLLAGCTVGAAAAAREGNEARAVLGDDHFGAGAIVTLAEPVAGDALLAGGTVESNASVGGDVTAAGGQVAVRATVGDDLYAAGGRVEVDALVSGNARLAGGRVVVAPESRIDGGTSVAGGTVTLDGRFGRYLTVTGGEVTLGGNVAGDVLVYAESLAVRPGTRIGGRLAYRTAEPVTLPAGVEVLGGVAEASRRPGRDEDVGVVPGGIGWLWLAGLFTVGLLLAWALAAFSRRTTRALTERPWIGMAVGLLVLVCVPAVTLALFVTLIGIPLALILLLLYLAMLIAAYVVGALFLGDRVLIAARRQAPLTAGWRLLGLALVLVALALVSAIPVMGDLVRLAVLLLGLGGIVLAVLGGSAHGPAPV